MNFDARGEGGSHGKLPSADSAPARVSTELLTSAELSRLQRELWACDARERSAVTRVPTPLLKMVLAHLDATVLVGTQVRSRRQRREEGWAAV